jgi:hypothetical protein
MARASRRAASSVSMSAMVRGFYRARVAAVKRRVASAASFTRT